MMRMTSLTPCRRAAIQRAQDRILKRARDQERLEKLKSLKPLTAQQEACRAGAHRPLDMDFFGLRCSSCRQLVYGI